ncbi:MAG TPA: hypothetical protein VL096_19335 [Pirellulaceae bacterium]|nr:hypothetical protein [Pirellulaceae bacterium]
MSTTKQTLTMTRGIALFAGLLLLTGCGSNNGLNAVHGRVELAGGDASLLAGHNVEAALESNPNVRAYGAVAPDGSFKLESLINGKVQTGAQQGNYKVRVVLGDEDPAQTKLVASKIDPRHLRFETSGVALQVPSHDIVLRLQGRK